jgi:hypothetical protein
LRRRTCRRGLSSQPSNAADSHISRRASAATRFATTLLELAATSVGEGIVAGGFVAAAVGMVVGRSRRELEGNTLP